MGDDLGAFEQQQKNFTRLEVLLDTFWAEFEHRNKTTESTFFFFLTFVQKFLLLITS